MRIAFNATPLLSPFTGIGQYTFHLAKGLNAAPSMDLDFFYGFNWSKALREYAVPGITSVKSAAKKMIPNVYFINRLLQQRQFNRGIKRYSPEIYHEPNTLAFPCDLPTITTVHDLSWIRYPEMHPLNRVRNLNRYFEPNLERAALILTDSEFVKRELMDVFGIEPQRIQPVLLGVESCFHPQTANDVSSVLAGYELSYGKYILAVGTLEPRKNLQTVLEAYQMLPQAIRQRFPLVVAGMKGWNTSAIEKQIAPLIHSGQIRQIGYLPRKELAAVMAGAVTMVFPSVYEGFGLPPLEAMACGVPVIASRAASLPEVVGDAGVMVDPYDAAGIAASIQHFIDDPDERLTYSQKALVRSAGFTWDKCVTQTMDCYRQVLR